MLIDDLMTSSGVGFGTSGARGLAAAMTDAVCHAYTRGFLGYLAATGQQPEGGAVAIGGDLRPSTPRIMRACARAIADAGYRAVNLGEIPSPAVAAYGIARGLPSLMVTGSHIPDDRNGIKFNLPSGEILKEDEAGIRAQRVDQPASLFAADGQFARTPPALPACDVSAARDYVQRFLDFFPPDCLADLRIGLYEHSTVARDLFAEILSALGAEVTPLARSARFVPVDTEAIHPRDVALAREWGASGRFAALVSADGDGDRPLVGDERGRWLRGDIAGILCARALGARAVVTPVSSNTAVERCGWFATVRRTRIGSPHVIAGMRELVAEGLAPVVGYEANGGFLQATPIVREGRRLAALPTRDALIVAVSLLAEARATGVPVSALAAALPARHTSSDRSADFPTALARDRLAAFMTGEPERDLQRASATFAAEFGDVVDLDSTDGVRMTFASGEILHLRPSGNAPELRAYTEAATPERAAAMTERAMALLAGWRAAG